MFNRNVRNGSEDPNASIPRRTSAHATATPIARREQRDAHERTIMSDNGNSEDEHRRETDADASTRSDDGVLDRRDYLKLTGATAATGAGFSLASSSASAATSHHGISFDRVKHAVNDLGMDPNGNDPIDDDIEFTNGTLIEFPPGEYLVQNKVYENGLHRWGIRGTGSDRGQVRFRPPNGDTQTLFQINGYDFRDDCTDILIENVTFDQSATTATAASNQFYIKDGLEIHDVETYGYNPNRGEANAPNNKEINGLYLMIYDSSGTGVVKNYKYVGETTVVDYPKNASGISVYRNHDGTLYVRDCNIENRGEHAIYASKCSGGIRVEGGTFKNNANTNMRISGSGSYLEDATIGIDRDRSYFIEADTGDEKSGRGMWWEAGDVGKTGGHIDDCDFFLDTNLDTPGLVRVEGTTGAMEIRNSRIQNNSNESTNTVFVQQIGQGPGGATPPTPHDVEITNCSFTGSSPSPAVESNRDAPVTVSDCCEDMPNGGGFQGELSTNNISRGGCPVPGDGGGSHTLEIMGSGDRASYSFSVDGNLQGSGNLQDGDNVFNDGQSAAGAVTGGTDTYTFDGDLRAFNFSGDAINVHLDGEPAHVGQRPDHLLQIEGQGTSTPYSFNVSSNLQGGGNLQNNDNIVNNGWSASGEVGDGTDSYTFDGDLVSFDFDGTVNVLLDGQSAHVGQHPDHLLQIEGTGTSVDYDFTVSGGLQKTTAGGGSINSSDDITNNGQSAAGSVGGGTDSYTFDGDLRAFDLDGEMNVLLDGESAHVGRLPDDV